MGNWSGVYWASVTGEYILKQNERIARGELAGKPIQLDTVGWTNGCVDQLVQAEWCVNHITGARSRILPCHLPLRFLRPRAVDLQFLLSGF